MYTCICTAIYFYGEYASKCSVAMASKSYIHAYIQINRYIITCRIFVTEDNLTCLKIWFPLKCRVILLTYCNIWHNYTVIQWQILSQPLKLRQNLSQSQRDVAELSATKSLWNGKLVADGRFVAESHICRWKGDLSQLQMFYEIGPK